MVEPADRKVALITGAARGLGRAMALGLVRAGYVVAGCDLPASAAELALLADHAKSRAGQFHPIQCDVTNSDHCRAAVEGVLTCFGSVDILVNDAAIGMEVITPLIHNNPYKFYEIEERFWQRVFDINLLGTFRMTRLVAPLQVNRGGAESSTSPRWSKPDSRPMARPRPQLRPRARSGRRSLLALE